MDELVVRAVEAARDRDMGASEVLSSLLPLLAEAVRAGRDRTRAIVRAICEAQPGMAPLWNACAAAAADAATPGTFARFEAGARRRPAALTRAAASVLRDQALGVARPRFLTVSYSGSVCDVLAAVASVGPVEVVCAEGRPRLEGRRTAERLAAAGAAVTLTTDAAIGVFLPGATAVVTGADAITGTSWINKVGTLGLAASAGLAGVPVLVLASQDKFLPSILEPRLVLADGPPSEVLEAAPVAVTPANPVFEPIPLSLATVLVTDRGPAPPSSAAEIARQWSSSAEALIQAL